jgi:hypothetical protein
VLHADAQALPDHLGKLMGRIDYVISGLPILWLPPLSSIGSSAADGLYLPPSSLGNNPVL